MPKRYPLLLLAAATPAPAEPEIHVLEPLRIEAPRWEAGWRDTPAAVGSIDLDADQAGAQGLTVDEALNRLPGVYVQNRDNFAQGERIAIRGFGARAAFGVRGIRVLLDDLPLTLPDGQTPLDGLDLGLAEGVEVIRGPASALYGNAAGGVVRFRTPAPPDHPYAEAGLTLGDFGLRGLRLEGGGRQEDWGALGAANAFRRDGYRDHSAAAEAGFYGKLAREAGEDTELTTLLSLGWAEAEDPGALTAAQMAMDREQASSGNLLYDAGERETQGRLGWVLRRRPETGTEWRARLFVGRRLFDNRLPFEGGGQVEFQRGFGGLGLQYLRRGALMGRPNRYTVGADLEFQRDDRRRYDNLQGDRGPLSLDQREQVRALGLFAENEWGLAPDWRLTLGGRWDQVRLAVDDHFQSDGDDSGARTLDEPSLLLGLSHALSATLSLYASLASAFETPTTTELANPAGGGFNPDLESQRALNREIGLKAETRRLRVELALYSILLRDELLPYELPEQPGRTYYRNAGESRRDGLELALDWRPAPLWRVVAAYHLADYRFTRYQLGGDDYAGNTVPGLPCSTLFGELAFDTGRYFARLELLRNGRLYADDANAVAVEPYALAHLRIGWRFGAGQVYLGVNNLTEVEYAGNVRINAFGGRYFEPAPDRHLFLGLALGL